MPPAAKGVESLWKPRFMGQTQVDTLKVKMLQGLHENSSGGLVTDMKNI